MFVAACYWVVPAPGLSVQCSDCTHVLLEPRTAKCSVLLWAGRLAVWSENICAEHRHAGWSVYNEVAVGEGNFVNKCADVNMRTACAKLCIS